MQKKMMCGILAGVVLMGLCSGCGNDQQTDENNVKEKIRMTYTVGELDGKSKDLNVVFEDFYKEHPNCEIVIEEGGTSLMAKIAANDAPDIIRVDAVSDLPTYVNKNVILPLDDMLAGSELFKEDDIYQLALDSFRYDGKEFGKGKIYGLPKDWAPDCTWVNQDLLAEAGLEAPAMTSPMTYSQFFDVLDKISKKEGNQVSVYGMCDTTGGVWNQIEKMLNLQGESMWSEDFLKIDLKRPEVRDAFQYFYNIYYNGYAPSALYPTDGNGNSDFAKGKVGINIASLYSGNVYKRNEARTVDFDKIKMCPPIVSDATKKVLATCSPTGAVISANTKNKELAFACWEYIHLGDLVEKRASTGLNMPIKKSVAKAVVLDDEFMNQNYEFARQLSEAEPMFVRTNPYVSNQGVKGVFEKYFTPLLHDQYTFDEALNLIESEIQMLIDEGNAN